MIRWSFFLTKESDKDFVKKDLSKRIDLNYVSFVECDYSYAELMDLDKWLFDFFTKNNFLYLQPIITQYFIDNKSEIWLLFLIAHSKR